MTGNNVNTVKWLEIRSRHPWLFMLIVAGKRCRTKIGLLLVLVLIGHILKAQEMPIGFAPLHAVAAIGLVLIMAGTTLRIGALGILKKKELLSSGGAYSLCRHPLYTGSILITYGFCCLLGHLDGFVVATLYFLLFYSLTIIWEEIRLAERYGTDHQAFAQSTPLLLPVGRYRPGAFNWRTAHSNGAGLLLLLVALLLAGIQLISRLRMG